MKFQKTDLNEKFTQSMLDSPYANSNSWGSTYGEHKRFIEFSNKEFYNLKYYAENEVGIAFTSSAMDPVSKHLIRCDVASFKTKFISHNISQFVFTFTTRFL